MDEPEKSEVFPALRINQLDAHELDHEFEGLLLSQLTTALTHIQSSWVSRIQPELKALLRLIVWKATVDKSQATFGQQLLNIKYRNVRPSFASRWISSKQGRILATLLIGGGWLRDRSSDLERLTEGIPYSDKLWRAVEYVVLAYQGAWLLNSLVFLQRGGAQHLWERLVGVRAVFPERETVRQVGFEFMSRELLWHGFAEFLFFLLPFVNFTRIRSTLFRLIGSSRVQSSPSDRSRADLMECAVCSDWPTMPREIGCRHVFCYYCVHSNFKAVGGKFSCDKCGYKIERKEDITAVTLSVQ